jgi:MFS family permease
MAADERLGRPNRMAGRVWRATVPLYAVPGARGRRGLLASVLVDALGSGMFLPVSLLFFNVIAGQSVQAAGEILSIATFASIPMGPLAGALVDRIGVKAVTIAAQIAQGTALVGYLIFDNFAALTVAAFVAAVGTAWFWAGNTALVSQVATSDDLGRWFGLDAALRNLGYAVGAVLTSVIVTIGSADAFRAIIAADAFSFLIAALLLRAQQISRREPAAAEPQGRRQTATYRAVLQDAPFLRLMAANVGLVLVGASLPIILTVFIVRAAHYSASLAAAMFVVNTVLIILLQNPVACWCDRHSKKLALQAAALLYMLGSLGLALYRAEKLIFVPLLVLCIISFSLAEVLYSPAMSAIVTSACPPELVGRYSGVYQLSYSVAFAVAPVSLTWLLTVSGSTLWLALSAVSVVAGLAVSRWVPA